MRAPRATCRSSPRSVISFPRATIRRASSASSRRKVLVVPTQEGPEVDLGGKGEALGGRLSHAMRSRPPSQPLGYHTRSALSISRWGRRHAVAGPPGGTLGAGWGTATSRASSRSCSRADRRRGVGQGARALLGLGERDDVPDGIDAGQDGDDPVQPERDAAHRRGAVLQGLQEEAELGPRRRPRRSRGSRRPAAGAHASGCESSPPPISCPFSTRS